MKLLLSALIVAIVVAISHALPGRHVISRKSAGLPDNYKHLKRANPKAELQFSLQLHQQNLDKLEEIFWDVSDPKSPNFHKFLSKKQIEDLVAPPDAHVSEIKKWLIAAGIDKQLITYRKGSAAIEIRCHVAVAERLLLTQFHRFVYAPTKMEIIRHMGTASIPVEFVKYIDFISGISEFFHNAHLKVEASGFPMQNSTTKVSRASQSNQATFKANKKVSGPVVIPSVLRTHYGIPDNKVAGSTIQAVAAFGEYYSTGALALFDSTFGVTPNTISKTVGPISCLPTCQVMESDLDTQYMTSMGQSVNTWFWNTKSGSWILQWLQDVQAATSTPNIFSASYGWAEDQQCAISSTKCTSLGYTSEQYVSRSDSEFQKLGAQGITFLVSSGDDGAPGYYDNAGTVAIDGVNNYCIAGGCAHTSSQCASLDISTGSTHCYYPLQGACTILSGNSFQTAFGAFYNANTGCNFAVEVDSRKQNHFYSSCACADLKSVTNSGYTIKGFVFESSMPAAMTPNYPAGSPYVTSVSATQLTGSSPYGEIAASIETGAIITTGGGFSAYETRPSYQDTAVSAYLTNHAALLPPSYTFSSANRAYPDISFAGHAFQIYASTANEAACPCEKEQVDGTSASSPSLAGMFALINNDLLAAGKPSLGFLNPTLYQMYAADSSAFNDITSGNNKCNRAYCAIWGFECATGWDPVTGLGSPVYSKMHDYILAQ